MLISWVAGLFKQFMKFFGVGIVSTLLDWAIFALAFKLAGFPYWLALIISFAFGAVVNFLMNKKLTFQNKSKSPFQPLVFFIIAGFMLGISLILMSFLVEAMDALLARMIVTGIIFVINFVVHKMITFGRFFQ
jgi:putative flippase GtrA